MDPASIIAGYLRRRTRGLRGGGSTSGSGGGAAGGFHHFESKEALALEVVRRYAASYDTEPLRSGDEVLLPS